MNKTKYALIIAAIVLSICSIAFNVYMLIEYFISAIKAGAITSTAIFFGIYEILGIIAYLVATGLLIYSIAGKGRHFRGRNMYFMSAFFMIVILNTFSVPSVLLLITLFIPDIVWVKPHDDVYFSPKEEVKNDDRTFSEKEKARKIEELRRLKAEGKITDEEFNEQLFKLL